MAGSTYKYLDYEGLKTLAKNVNDKINNATTSPIDLDDIEWDVLTRPALGTFYIDNVPWQFKIGMTWEDWCDSVYSEGSGLLCSVSMIVAADAPSNSYITSESDIPSPWDSIIDNHKYKLHRKTSSGGWVE